MADKRTIIFIGTYNRTDPRGIYVYELNHASGAMKPVGVATGITNPSFLVLTPNGKFLYTTCDIDKAGAVAAFAVTPGMFALTPLNHQPAHGTGPCHIDIDRERQILLVANYSSGSVASYPIRPDGSIGEVGSVVQHQGGSVNKSRQEGPHAHSITVDPAGRYAVSADLGNDKLLVYKLDACAGTMTPSDPPFVDVKAGAGPRHFAFAPRGKFGYLINELDSTMIAYAYDAAKGRLTHVQTISTLPPEWKGNNWPAAVHLSPDGRFLYGSNRGYDSIAIFALDASRGTMTFVGVEPTQGQHPRDFNITPRGDFMLVANQESDNLLSFRIDPKTGKLQASGQVIHITKPACIQMIDVE